MIFSKIMDRYGWTDVWVPGPNRYAVGVWTGPGRDILCVVPCLTAEQAERWISPVESSLLAAMLRAWARRGTFFRVASYEERSYATPWHRRET